MTTALLPAHPDPIAALWREARSWLADALCAFGEPVEIACSLAREARAALKRRLLRIETLLMKLLLIEASRVRAKASLASRRRPLRAQARAGAGGAAPVAAAEDPARPETWRVRFRLGIPPDPKPPARPRDTGGPRIRDLGRPLLVRDIWREQSRRQLCARLHPEPDAEAAQARAAAKSRKLARRLEALRRVLANPRAAVAALARRLSALGCAAYAAARRIALAPPPRGKREGRILADAVVHAHDCCGVFDSS
jgi:hypothetical protein